MMATGQELVDGYLQRLATATADLPPDVRDDLLTDMRTHLLEAQERAASDVEVRAALDRLGSPEAIAAEARGPVDPGGAGPWTAPPPAGGTGWTAPPPAAGTGWTAPPPAAGTGWTAPRPRERTTSSLGYDATALLILLFAGAVLGLLAGIVGWLGGWIVGVGLVWASRTWTGGEKALATLVWPGGYLLPMILGLSGSQVCTSGSEVTVVDELLDGTIETYVQPGTAIAEQCTGFALPVWLGIPLLVVLVAAPIAVAWLLLRRGDARRAAEREA
jgi:hypothetical protein